LGRRPVRRGWISPLSACCDTDGSCRQCSAYRFLFRIQRAKELAGQTREMGGALLAAFEKRRRGIPRVCTRAS
jgi:hypothetical protein